MLYSKCRKGMGAMKEIIDLLYNYGIGIICVAYMIYFQNTTMKEMLKTLSNMDTRLTAIETHLDIDDKKAEKGSD